MSLYAQVATTLDPGLCTICARQNIPTAANGNTGNNWTRTNVPALDTQLKIVDTSLDDADREPRQASRATT